MRSFQTTTRKHTYSLSGQSHIHTEEMPLYSCADLWHGLHCHKSWSVQSYMPGRYMIPWAYGSLFPQNGISTGSAAFAGLTVITNTQTDTTDHATCDIFSNSPHLTMLALLVMWANNTTCHLQYYYLSAQMPIHISPSEKVSWAKSIWSVYKGRADHVRVICSRCCHDDIQLLKSCKQAATDRTLISAIQNNKNLYNKNNNVIDSTNFAHAFVSKSLKKKFTSFAIYVAT